MMVIINKVKEKIRFKRLENKIFSLRSDGDIITGIEILRQFYIAEARHGKPNLNQLRNFNDSVEEFLGTAK